MHPRVQLILGGDIISVQFGDAIALVATRKFVNPSKRVLSNV